jgi:dethiobiotin synthetase
MNGGQSEPRPVRPDLLVAVVGVATEVGKTWATTRVVARLAHRGLAVSVRKPVQSFAPGEVGGTDAELLALASSEAPDAVCPPHRWYPVAVAPPMAAEMLGRDEITARDLLHELCWPVGTAVGLVETAGGVRSPIADDADCAEFVRLLQPDRTVLVADAGLGTINAVRLACQALDGLRPIVLLNRYDDSVDLHRRNRRWLDDRDAHDIVVDVATLCDRIIAPTGATGPL